MYKAYRFYISSGYIEIQANSEQEARDKCNSGMVIMQDGKDTFVCISINSATSIELIEGN